MNPHFEAGLNHAHRALSRYGARVAVLDTLEAMESAPIATGLGKMSRFGARIIEAVVTVEKPMVVVGDEVYNEIMGDALAASVADRANYPLQ